MAAAGWLGAGGGGGRGWSLAGAQRVPSCRRVPGAGTERGCSEKQKEYSKSRQAAKRQRDTDDRGRGFSRVRRGAWVSGTRAWAADMTAA